MPHCELAAANRTLRIHEAWRNDIMNHQWDGSATVTLGPPLLWPHPEGQRAFTGSYKAQNLERGPRHGTFSGNLRSRNPMLQSLGFRHFAQLPALRASG
jgi:hypothetical protein